MNFVTDPGRATSGANPGRGGQHPGQIRDKPGLVKPGAGNVRDRSGKNPGTIRELLIGEIAETSVNVMPDAP